MAFSTQQSLTCRCICGRIKSATVLCLVCCTIPVVPMFHPCEYLSSQRLEYLVRHSVVHFRPPKVAFKWRHWGKMTGPLTCPLHNGLRMVAQPTNEVVSMLGVACCSLNDKFQIQDLEVYFDQTEPMNSMVKVNGSPLGLPAKGKTPGGVEMEMKPVTTPVSPERVKAITRTESQSGYTKETGRTMVTPTHDRQHSSDSDKDDAVTSGRTMLSDTLSGIWGLLRLRS